MKIDSIRSDLPNWYDPDAPDYLIPKTFTGSRVRIVVPVDVNPTKELSDARINLQLKYPGAILHLIPKFSKFSDVVNSLSVTTSDEDLLRSYFNLITLPNHVTVDQITSYITKFIPLISVFGSKGLKFKSVIAENVLCFEHCEIDLDQTGLTLVTGLNKDWNDHSNGSGKSSWTSLTFIALFGRTFKNQSHDEWASQFNEKTAKLTLTMILSDDRELKVIRCRRPGSLRAFLDGNEVTMGTASATQNLIERLTNLTWEVLTNALYIGQSEIGSVFGTEKDRKELFSRLLGLERFLDAQVKLSKIALRIKKSVDAIDSEIDMADARIQEISYDVSNLSSDLKALPKISETKVLNLTRDLNNVLSEIQSKEKALSTCILLREACLIEIRGWTEKTTESQTQIKTFQKTLDASRDAKERCYVCGNNVDPTILKAFQTDLINAIIAEKKILLEHALGLSKLSEKISGLREKERKLIIEIDKLRTLESSLNRNIQHLQSQSSHSKRLKTAISEKRTRIKVLEKIKLVHEQAKQFTLEEKQFVDICVNAVSRNGIPAYLCESVTPQLNNTAQHYSEVFSEGEIGIQFAASNGDVDVNICNQHGGKQTKDQSAGEMRIAAIITAFTFRDVMLPLNLLIVDEPSEGLDPANSLAFAKGLMQVLDRFQHVMIISHSTNLLSALEPDRRVEIVKTNRISRASIVTV